VTRSAVAETVEVRQIAIELLEASPLNPRKTYDDRELTELAASIKQIGITSPLLVRPLVTDGIKEELFEIVAGHRRSEAATMAGLFHVPCVVREMDDATAADVALIDNLQRADVPALEESEAFNALLARCGSIEGVASKVGKDVAYVAKRLKLAELGEHSRKALAARLITVDHALLLARLGPEEEDAALKWCLDTQAGSKTKVEDVVARAMAWRNDEDRWRAWEPESVVRLKEHIEQSSGRKLARAPWSLADAELVPAAGACNGCPSNTKSNTALFADLDIDDATCANGICFESKRTQFVHIQRRQAESQAAEKLGRKSVGDVVVLRVSWKLTSTVPRQLKDGGGVNPEQLFKDGQWVEAKKVCEGAQLAVTVDWSDANSRGYLGNSTTLRKPGEIIRVCVQPKCKAHPKAYEKAARVGNGGARLDEAAEKAAREKMAEAARAETRLRIAVASLAVEGMTQIPLEAVRVLAVSAFPRWERDQEPLNAVLPGIAKILKTAKLDSAEFARAVALVSIGEDELRCSEYRSVDDERPEFLAAVRRLGFKGATPWDKPPAAKKAAKRAAVKKVAKKAAKPAAKKKGARS
jgi:ParB/RepB/Spo0J family partition protein